MIRVLIAGLSSIIIKLMQHLIYGAEAENKKTSDGIYRLTYILVSLWLLALILTIVFGLNVGSKWESILCIATLVGIPLVFVAIVLIERDDYKKKSNKTNQEPDWLLSGSSDNSKDTSNNNNDRFFEGTDGSILVRTADGTSMPLDVYLQDEEKCKQYEKKLEQYEKEFKEAAELINRGDSESNRTGRGKMLELAYHDLTNHEGPSYPKAILWLASDLEKHQCYREAAERYKQAWNRGEKEGEEGFKRCYNPYHIDPSYSLDGGRHDGTHQLRLINEIKENANRDYSKAISVLSGNPTVEEAQNCLSVIYLIASAHNCCVPEAQQWMGDYCETVDKNDEEAVIWYKKAADNGSAEGARCYADMLISGRGIEKNTEEAIKYYRVAADQGHEIAAFVLGQIYYNSGDYAKANDYYQKSASKGYEPAKEAIKELEDKKPSSMLPSHKALLESAFINVVKIRELSDEGIIEFIPDIYHPEDFCTEVYEWCNDNYGDLELQKLAFEYNLTSFYGGICAVALWDKNKLAFIDSSAWEVVKNSIKLETVDVYAELYLGTQNGEELADKIYEDFQQYLSISMSVMERHHLEKKVCVAAMSYAYKLGLLIAENELYLDIQNPIKEYVAILESTITTLDFENIDTEPRDNKSEQSNTSVPDHIVDSCEPINLSGKVDPNQKACPKCGALLHDDSDYCHKCGAKVSNETLNLLYLEKWNSQKADLKKRFNFDTSTIEGIKLDSDIIVRTMLDHSLDRNSLVEDEYNNTLAMSNTDDTDELYICFQRMADLCQGLDYAPAGIWLGEFCETILEKYEDAQYWYNRAARLNDGLGMYRVGMLYLNKKIPVPESTSLKRCFTDAAERGITEANDILTKYFS